jgi:hypothetical protein
VGRGHPTSIVVFATLLALVLPAQSLACTIPIRQIGPIDLHRDEVRRPVYHQVTRAAWGLDSSWVSTAPRLSQFVRTTRFGTWFNVSYARQQAISIDAPGPENNRWLYFEDDDPVTPPCALVGQIEWQKPKILVVQTPFMVRVTAVSQRTEGSREGCILGPDFGLAPCPNLTRTIIRLTAPIGNRQLRFEAYPTTA